MILRLHFDGACEPVNPGGTGAWGFVLRYEDGTLFADGRGSIAAAHTTTNNLAEYLALIRGLERVLLAVKTGKPGFNELEIYGDSLLVCNQVMGSWACRAANLQPLLAEVKDLIRYIALPCRIQWVRREMNEEADALSRLGWTEATGKTFPERVKAVSGRAN